MPTDSPPRAAHPVRDSPALAVYLLTDHRDVPWCDDGMRRGDLAMRDAMTGWFADGLTTTGSRGCC
jgi:hypothetical protein